MRVRIHRPDYHLEFDGSPAVWNELLRPLVGGPEAPPDPEPDLAPVAAPAPAQAPAAAPAAVAPAAPAPAVPRAVPAPVAAPAPAPVAAPSPVPSVRTFRMPPREPAPYRGGGRPEAPRDHHREDDDVPPWRRRGGPEPEIRIEPSNDPDVLYARLIELGSRRAEKDAVLAAVWFLGRGRDEVHERQVDEHFAAHGGPEDVKIRAVFAKHVSRTKCLEPGTGSGLVRLTAKGREQIRLLCGV